MDLCRRTSSAILCKIPKFGTWANFFLVRGHQNLDDLDSKLPILIRRMVFRPHASRLPPSPRIFCTLFTLPVVIPIPPSDSFQDELEQLAGNRHLRHLEDHVPGRGDNLRPDLDELVPQRRQGPMLHAGRQTMTRWLGCPGAFSRPAVGAKSVPNRNRLFPPLPPRGLWVAARTAVPGTPDTSPRPRFSPGQSVERNCCNRQSKSKQFLHRP